MKVSELREMSADEVKNRLEELHEEAFNLRFQHVSGQLTTPIRLRGAARYRQGAHRAEGTRDRDPQLGRRSIGEAWLNKR